MPRTLSPRRRPFFARKLDRILLAPPPTASWRRPSNRFAASCVCRWRPARRPVSRSTILRVGSPTASWPTNSSQQRC
jgi:hypothetical protein